MPSGEVSTRSRRSITGVGVLSLVVGLLALPPAESAVEAASDGEADHQSAEPRGAPDPARVFDHLLVTGGARAVESLPGAADFIGEQQLERQGYTDLHRILRQVPGINIQEEEGYGLRPNIGIRGTGVERSQKITLLEDGVLIAPAPYAAPAAYYVPTSGRMASMEVRKGSAAVGQGPYTTGGVVNFVSTAIPSELGGGVRLSCGSEDTWRLHADAGSSSERWGWLLETFQFDTDGFKNLDGGGPAGVRLEDYLAKIRLNSRSTARHYQLVELKLGRTDQFGEETYLGLTEADFDLAPYRRYAGSQEDWIDTDHRQLQLRYFLQPGTGVNLTATLYRNDFFRNWHKLQSVSGVAIGDVLREPERFVRELSVLRGESDDFGGLRIRNNRRDYRAQGIDGLLEWRPAISGAEHHLQLGVRLHEDSEDRFQEEDSWSMTGGRMSLERLGAPGSQANRIDEAEAIALFVRDSISIGRWSISPGVRFERVDFRRRDYGGSDPGRGGDDLSRQENNVDAILPGVALGYSPGVAWNVFAGVHRGFAPPGPGQDPETRAEESWNYELGLRFRSGATAARAIAFFSDYSNLLGRDTLSSGGEGTGDAFNGGRVEVIGLEASAEHDLGAARGSSWGLPVSLVYTYTEGHFRTSFETGFADWAPEVRNGDELPYLPTHQLAAGVGVVKGPWSAYLDVAFVGAMRTAPATGSIPDGEGTDEYLVVDASLSYQLLTDLRVLAQARNLADEIYLVARRPAGVRPGRPRAVLLGVEWDF